MWLGNKGIGSEIADILLIHVLFLFSFFFPPPPPHVLFILNIFGFSLFFSIFLKNQFYFIDLFIITILKTFWPYGMQDLSSLTKNQILAPCIGSVES